MIKNKKYSGFSLIEAMVLFMGLSLILLAFLPVMFKRPEKTTESDCVGGLRSVRQEFYVEDNGDDNFIVPVTIASPVSVMMIGGGGGGGNPTVEHKEEILNTDKDNPNHCVFKTDYGNSQYHERKLYRNMYLTMIGKGRQSTCSGSTIARAGASGDHYVNLRVFPDSSASHGTEILNVDLMNNGTIKSNTFKIFNGKTLTLNSSSSPQLKEDSSIYNRYMTLTPLRIDGDSRRKTLEPVSKLSGGIPATRIIIKDENNNDVVAGAGQECIWDPDSSDYVAGKEPSNGVCKLSYNHVTVGNPGTYGVYMRLSLPLGPEYVCSINVGQGGESNGGTGGQTSIVCNNGIKFIAKGARGNLAAEYNQDTDVSNIDYVAKSQYGWPEISTSENVFSGSSFAKRAGLSIYNGGFLGGRNGCVGIKDNSVCDDPNGKPGYDPGSGGGGGSCGELSCGVGGRGGDGLAVIEYLEYCK